MAAKPDATMISVRFFEGGFERGNVIHDTLLAVVPRVGETITLRSHLNREEPQYEVLRVDYLIDIQQNSISPVNELTGVRVQVRPI